MPPGRSLGLTASAAAMAVLQGGTEAHAHALLFTSFNGSRYLLDSATGTVHPWPWPVAGRDLDGIYEQRDEELEAFLSGIGAPMPLGRYVLLWRQRVGAFQAVDDAPDRRKVAPRFHSPMPSLLANLILVVTDGCNLRCRYCILGGTYPGYKPIRPRDMSWDTAKSAVDHFIALNRGPVFEAMPSRKINISFFGGEPLLKADLIEHVVRYARTQEAPDCGYWIDFAMTSNLTHLPDGVAAMLIANDIGMQVSLDGPEAVHDACRVNAGGRGSFRLVMRNLAKLRRLSPEYFRRRVSAVVTLNGNTDLRAVHEFFESGGETVPPVGFVGLVRDLERSQFHRTNPFDPARLWAQYVDLMEEYRRRKREGMEVSKGQFLYRLFEEALQVLNGRTMQAATAHRHTYTGTCQPGRRLTVSTDGRFHLCERINEEFPIGDVTSGVDWERAAALLQQYYDQLPDCDRCWARPICGTCMANNCQGDHFEFGPRCDHARFELQHRLRLLCTVLEENPDALATGDPTLDERACLGVTP